jgi:hypothetical protein
MFRFCTRLGAVHGPWQTTGYCAPQRRRLLISINVSQTGSTHKRDHDKLTTDASEDSRIIREEDSTCFEEF